MGRVESTFSRRVRRRSDRRARRILVFFFVFASILAVVNVAGWRFYRATRGALDSELGARLAAISIAATRPIDVSDVEDIRRDPEGSLGALSVRLHFEELASDLDLANVSLLDVGGRSLVDLNGGVPAGEPHPVASLHRAAFTAARSGLDATSDLYASHGAYYKNGYAPLRDGEDVIAVVAVEAGAGYFGALDRVRHAALLAGGASAIAIVLLGVTLFRTVRMQWQLDETLQRTETLSMMGEMAASVAHEIKNPLGIIRATAERLRKRHGTGEELFDYIPAEVDRLTTIVDAYLAFARRGGAGDAGAVADVGEVAGVVLGLVRADLDHAGVDVTVDVPTGLGVALDAGALQQVILNLVLNARQAMPEGGTLRVSAELDGDEAVVCVTDTGVGIAADDLDAIFRPFHSGRETGSGLGLAISQRVVSDAGGRIDVTSAVGSGTEFRVRLPRVPFDGKT